MTTLAESETATQTTAPETAPAPQDELAKEQQRLAKLWDAFRKQEDEYRALERERDELWARVQEMEKAMGSLGDPAEVQARLSELTKENAALRGEVDHLGAQLTDHSALFRAEQQRLAKLFRVYQDAELRLKRAQRTHVKMERTERQLREKVKRTLTAKQLAQRKYAAQIRVIRQRAKQRAGGRGRISKRPAATRLRRRLGLKEGKP